MNKVAVVMGSKSDLDSVKHTMEVLDEFAIEYEVKILSAHRTPDETIAYARGLYERGFKVVIAAAGGAAHLAGVIAGCQTLPVIGIPMQTKTLDGLDSLLSIVQMPAGVPVATVAVGKAGCKNAAVLAATIIAAFDDAMHDKLVAYKEDMRKKVLETTID
ncbi:MAG: 5-(carboxyamino)imidazole ribonucleotide mutase [Erysipelotrichaceae bacterium]|nr:5-(carboxyamino)imidazole ribonucleotide mutase [Erysipelotrichaceae bacterium]MDY5251738.1 5-(carboxyamino)imidazole ribonucleotide mutase [Erysipelotrichaceae bacterium]